MNRELKDLNTRELGRRSVYRECVDSTNSWLKRKGARLPHGTVCWTGCQTDGRGRLGRKWYSGKHESLSISVLFKPLDKTEMLPIICGLAVCQAMNELSDNDFCIKWPNDILCGELKVCGILCESVSGDRGFAVAGIGVNLLQTEETFKREGLTYAGSLHTVSGCAPTLDKTASAIINRLEPLWLTLKNGGLEKLLKQYESKCMTIGREVSVVLPNGDISLKGRAVGIAGDGCLLIDTGGGIVPVNAGQVAVRGPRGYV